MENLIEPNIHPVLVHFAYGLTLAAALTYIIAFTQKKEGLGRAADWMLGLAAISLILTVAAGFQAYYSVAHDGPSHEAMTTHRNWAVPSAMFILGLAFWRWMKRAAKPSGLFTALISAAAILLSVAAWWGGKVVYQHGIGDGHEHDHGDGGHGETTSEAGHDNSDGHHDTAKLPTETLEVDLTDPAGTVAAFHSAMSGGDTDSMKSLLAADVIISESGGAERSFDEYAGHHMPADIAFTKAVSTTLKKRDVIENAEMATVMSESQIHGMLKGKKIHNAMMETMVLRRENDGWKIVHIHWSSAPITGEHEH